MMNDILNYHNSLSASDNAICEMLHGIISKQLKKGESKVWHGHPVWFLEGNPIVGYSKQSKGVRLMFWSGTSFEEESLVQGNGKFKDASIFYSDVADINNKDLQRWLKKSIDIQWDYKNLVKKKGLLERLK